nr:Os08g0512801 [Ipomoea batatas]
MLAAWALNPPRAPAMADPVRFLSMLSSTKEATSVFSTLLTTSSFIMASQTTDLPRPSIQLTAAANEQEIDGRKEDGVSKEEKHVGRCRIRIFRERIINIGDGFLMFNRRTNGSGCWGNLLDLLQLHLIAWLAPSIQKSELYSMDLN